MRNLRNSLYLVFLIAALTYTSALMAITEKPAKPDFCKKPECAALQASAKSILEKTNEDKHCVDVKVGEKKPVAMQHSESPTSVSHLYELERPSDKEYTLNFKIALNHADADFVESQQEATKLILDLNNHYDHMDACLADLNPYMKGPNGQSLKLKITRPSVTRKITTTTDSNGKAGYKINSQLNSQLEKSSVNQITLLPKGSDKRANNEEHRQNLECATVVHEILHLAGLCDEYEEVWYGFIRNPQTGELRNAASGSNDITAYNCRVHGPLDSIMSSAMLAVSNVKGVRKVIGNRCSISTASNKQCQQLFNEWNGDSKNCPAGASPVFYVNNRTEYISEQDSVTRDFTFGHGMCWLNHIENKIVKSRNSLLFPAHFYALTRPGCGKYNKTYYACAHRAYKTDTGNTKDSERTCDKNILPEGCSDGESWLHSVTGVK